MHKCRCSCHQPHPSHPAPLTIQAAGVRVDDVLKIPGRSAAMNTPRTRREFLTEVGRGMLVATVGYEVAQQLGLATALAEETADTLSFGAFEPLVCLMQETPINRLVPTL